MKTKFLAFVLILVLTLSLTLSGCSEDAVKDLSGNVEPETVVLYDDVFKAQDYSDFAARLLSESFNTEANTLVSPLSIALAFTMVAEGAEGETREEIESVLGMDIEELRTLAMSYLNGNGQLSASNSLWINDIEDFTVLNDFLERNAAYHSADIFETKFSKKTIDEINNWVKDKTDGMIDKILDNLDARSVMCLVNALLFDAEWETPYTEHNVDEGEFITEEGTTQSVTYLFNSEYYYLEDDKATGFIKYYDGRDYAFAAMLPKEGVSVKEYVISLNGEKLQSLFENAEDALVYTSIPKFEYATDLSLKSVLKDMGMEKAFDEEKADFSKLGQVQDGNIWIGDAFHSTKISVTEQGTRAGAATAVVMYGNGGTQNAKEVFLTRPFVYMIVDMENNIPIFMGTLMSVTD